MLTWRSSTDWTTMKPLFLLLTTVLKTSVDCNKITAHPGENVTLTGPDCSANASVRLQRRGSDQYVYYCIDGHPIRPEHQEPSFVGRVKGTKCPLKSGIVSVVVMNVTREDSGEYEWLCKNNTRAFPSTVYLKVTDPGTADGGTTSVIPPPVIPPPVIPPSGIHLEAIVLGTCVLMMVVILILYLCCSRFRCRIPCRLRDQQDSKLPVTYREVKQQQV